MSLVCRFNKTLFVVSLRLVGTGRVICAFASMPHFVISTTVVSCRAVAVGRRTMLHFPSLRGCLALLLCCCISCVLAVAVGGRVSIQGTRARTTR